MPDAAYTCPHVSYVLAVRASPRSRATHTTVKEEYELTADAREYRCALGLISESEIRTSDDRLSQLEKNAGRV